MIIIKMIMISFLFFMSTIWYSLLIISAFLQTIWSPETGWWWWWRRLGCHAYRFIPHIPAGHDGTAVLGTQFLFLISHSSTVLLFLWLSQTLGHKLTHRSICYRRYPPTVKHNNYTGVCLLCSSGGFICLRFTKSSAQSSDQSRRSDSLGNFLWHSMWLVL